MANVMKQEIELLFQPYTFKKGISLKNKIVMAPMTTWASNDDYTISDEEVAHYKARVKGLGMVITGCSRVLPNGIGFTHEFASYDDSFIPSLKKLADAGKSGGAPAILQIYHAGNKAVSALVPNGKVVSASAIALGSTAFVENLIPPRPLEHEEILAVIEAFGKATGRAIDAGFDGIELHGAHGFLLQNFFSPVYNQRTDIWGGSLRNRMRFPLAVIQEIKRVISEKADRPFLLGYRISPEESAESYTINDILPFIDKLIEIEIDYLHVSLSDVLNALPIGKTDGKSIMEIILEHVDGAVPVIAAGSIKQPEDAAKAIGLGLTSVAIGQALIMNPNWLELAKADQPVEQSLDLSLANELAIPQKLAAMINMAEGWFTLTEKDESRS